MPPSISEPANEPQIPVQRRRVWPADYYSSATPDPVLPRWASYGCGALSVLVLAVVFVGGAYLSGGGFVQLMDFSFGITLGEMRGMYTPEVTKEQKDAMEREIETMRTSMRDGKIGAQRLQPVLRSIQKATRDDKLTSAEVQQITADAKKTAPPAR